MIAEKQVKSEIRTLSAPIKTLFSVLSICLFCLLSVLALLDVEYVMAAVFLFLSGIFIWYFLSIAAIVRISAEGVERKSLLSGSLIVTWDDLKQVGILGTRAFPRSRMNRGGVKYIYFSRDVLNEEDLFRLILKWPSRDVPYVPYRRRNIDTVSLLWKGDIERYNTGDRRL